MAARVTQSIVFAGTLQPGHTRVTQSILILGIGVGISCGNPPPGTVGVFYSNTFPSGGGVLPLIFSLIAGSFPPGLTLNTSTGVLSGTPTTAGVFKFTVQVADSQGGVASVPCAITILGNQSVVITMYGWKLYPEDPCAEGTVEVKQPPSVKQAV